MLSTIRNLAKSWIFRIIFVILIGAFAIWGVGDIFRGASHSDVAKVGDTTISDVEFKREFDRMVDNLRQRSGGKFDSTQARQAGLDRQVLYDLVQRAVLAQKAAKLGITASDKHLADVIQSDPNFSSTFGTFSKETYVELLRRAHFTPEAYERRLRSDLIREQMLRSVTGGIEAPRHMADAFYTFRNEQRQADYLVLTADLVPAPAEPGAEEIQSYYDDHKVDYTAPEYRKFSIVEFLPDSFESQVEVSDEDIKKEYDFDRDKYSVPERRTVQTLSFLTEKDARAAYDKIQKGASFEDIAAQRNLTPKDITQTKVTEDQIVDTKLAKAAFALKPNTVSEPINGELGWAILRVTDVEPGRIKPFAEAKDEIRKKLVKEGATEELYQATKPFEDALAEGKTLEEAAKAVGLKVRQVGFIDRQGKTPAGTMAEGLPEPDKVSEVLFNTDVGEVSDFEEIGSDGYFVLRTDQIKDAHLQPLDQVKGKVITAIKTEKREKALRDLAESIAERGNKGEKFANLAAQFDKSVLSHPPVKRDAQDETFSATLVQKLFADSVGDYVAEKANYGDSYVVAVVRKVIPASVDKNGPAIDQMQAVLTQSFDGDLVAEYLGAAEQELNVKIYQKVVDREMGVSPEDDLSLK